MDAEIKVPFAVSLKLSKVLSFEPGVGQDIIASHASPSARNQSFVMIFAF